MPPQLPDDEALRIFSSQSDDEIDSQYFSSKLGSQYALIQKSADNLVTFSVGTRCEHPTETLPSIQRR